MAENLSPRETEVLRLVASGKTTKEIGAELAIAASTVNWHVGNVHTKLGASSRAEAVAVAMTTGSIELDVTGRDEPAPADPPTAAPAPGSRAT